MERSSAKYGINRHAWYSSERKEAKGEGDKTWSKEVNHSIVDQIYSSSSSGWSKRKFAASSSFLSQAK